MIHYGTHCYVFTDRWADDQLHHLATAKSLGLELFELAVGDDVHFNPKNSKKEAESLGLTLSTSPGGWWPINCDISADNRDDRKRGLSWHMQQIDTTAAVGGIAYSGALYGHPGTVKRRIPPSDERQWIAEELHLLADYAETQGVAIVLEPMSHFRTHVVNTPDQLAHLIRMVDHQNVFALLDTYHMVTEVRDYGDAIEIVRDVIWGVHACENDRSVPGSGLVPWDSVFSKLSEINFNGYMLFETYNSSIGNPPGQFAFERGMFHNPCPDGEKFVRQGMEFLKNMETRYKI